MLLRNSIYLSRVIYFGYLQTTMVSAFIERSPEDLSKKSHDYMSKNGCFWLLLQIGLGYITRHYLRLWFMQSAQNLSDVPTIYILIPSRFMTCVYVWQSSAHQTHSFDYVLTFFNWDLSAFRWGSVEISLQFLPDRLRSVWSFKPVSHFFMFSHGDDKCVCSLRDPTHYFDCVWWFH